MEFATQSIITSINSYMLSHAPATFTTPQLLVAQFLFEKSNMGVLNNPKYQHIFTKPERTIKFQVETHRKTWEAVILPGINAVAPVVNYKVQSMAGNKQVKVYFDVED